MSNNPLMVDDYGRRLGPPPSWPDLGPSNWQYAPLEPAMHNALLGLGYDRNRDGMTQQWLQGGSALASLQGGPLDALIRAGMVRSQPPPQMPTYAPPPYPPIGSDPRWANFRPSGMVQDERPTGYLLRSQ